MSIEAIEDVQAKGFYVIANIKPQFNEFIRSNLKT